MTTQEILDRYTTAIAELGQQLEQASAARLELDELERAITLVEAARLLGGVEGTNEAQRKANLLVMLEADEDYSDLRLEALALRKRIAESDTQIQISRERCRLLRLSLALAAPQGVLEATA
jgi:hypothetical protein